MEGFLFSLSEMIDDEISSSIATNGGAPLLYHRLPYPIIDDTVGGLSIKLSNNSKYHWTRALKFMLCDLKWLVGQICASNKHPSLLLPIQFTTIFHNSASSTSCTCLTEETHSGGEESEGGSGALCHGRRRHSSAAHYYRAASSFDPSSTSTALQIEEHFARSHTQFTASISDSLMASTNSVPTSRLLGHHQHHTSTTNERHVEVVIGSSSSLLCTASGSSEITTTATTTTNEPVSPLDSPSSVLLEEEMMSSGEQFRIIEQDYSL
jgi:hypothetical protein